jgi:hypothetical protein
VERTLLLIGKEEKAKKKKRESRSRDGKRETTGVLGPSGLWRATSQEPGTDARGPGADTHTHTAASMPPHGNELGSWGRGSCVLGVG